jgi:hypothetical protein
MKNSVVSTLPPVFIVPRARLHDLLMLGAPPGIALKVAAFSDKENMNEIEKEDTRAKHPQQIIQMRPHALQHCNTVVLISRGNSL